MTDAGEIVEVRRDEAAGRYEAELADGSVAVVTYRERDGEMLVTHTLTPPKHRGRGIAGRLTRHVLDDAIERGLRLVPYCPYTAWFIREHPEYRDHVAPHFDL
ncbi:MAG: GNAT family N-acetyltransferase [Gemmatimonadota bacterium]